LLRIVTALLLLQHGTAKLFGFPHVAMFDDLQLLSLLGLAGILELAGGLLLLLGIYTRVVAFILSGEMAVAYFIAHAPRSFFPILNQGELAVLYCFVLLYLTVAGGGAYSLTDRRAAIQDLPMPPSI
jgi:putative oxidoreductase